MNEPIISKKGNGKIIIVVGGTREAAYQELKRIANGNGIVRRKFYDEVILDGYPFMAIGGEPEDVCFLRAVGFDVKIRTVEETLISKEMWRRINHVRSTNL